MLLSVRKVCALGTLSSIPQLVQDPHPFVVEVRSVQNVFRFGPGEPHSPVGDDIDVGTLRMLAQPKFSPASGPATTMEQRAVVYDVAQQTMQYLDLPSGLAGDFRLVGRSLENEIKEHWQCGFVNPIQIDSVAYPWSTQCEVFFEQFGGTTFICSGTLVDARTMVTAAHCMHEGNGGNFSEAVRGIPKWDGTADNFGLSWATHLATFTGWSEDGDVNHDVAYVRLSRPVGFLTGWLGVGTNDENQFWADQLWWMAGYPDSCFANTPNQLYSLFGTFDRFSDTLVEADMNSVCPLNGMSGSGIYFIDEHDNRFVEAIASYTDLDENGTTTNLGCAKITQSKLDFLAPSFIPEAYNDSMPDYTPMEVRLAAGQSTMIPVGGTFDFTYQLFNTSLFNPPLQHVNVRVYLSGNRLISEADTLIQLHDFLVDFAPKDGIQVQVRGLVPGSLAPGTHNLGVVIDEDDFNPADNDSSYWDSQEIVIAPFKDALTLTGPTTVEAGGEISLDLTGAPPDAQAFMMWSLSDNGTWIDGHPFDLGQPVQFGPAGVTAADGSWTVSGNLPANLQNTTVFAEIRVDLSGYIFDSNLHTVFVQ